MSTLDVAKLAAATAMLAGPSLADGWKQCLFDYEFQILNGEYFQSERASRDAIFNGEKVILFEESEVTIPLSGPGRFTPSSLNTQGSARILEVTQGHLDDGFLIVTYATIFKNGQDVSLMMTNIYGGRLECGGAD